MRQDINQNVYLSQIDSQTSRWIAEQHVWLLIYTIKKKTNDYR